jgi:hypothetical protein
MLVETPLPFHLFYARPFYTGDGHFQDRCYNRARSATTAIASAAAAIAMPLAAAIPSH